MLPRIGFDLDLDHDGRRWIYKSPARYGRALLEAGALPIPLFPGDPRPAREILRDLDGLLMTGGDDIHPRVFGAAPGDLPMTLLPVARERFVLTLAQAALDLRIPTLAVCLGCQALNLAAGGSIWIDLEGEGATELDHRNGKVHRIDPEPGGLLFRCWKGKSPRLPSHHHQAVRDLGEGLSLEARAEDGIIEAFGGRDHPFLLGLQWHPELQGSDPGGRDLIEHFVRSAEERSGRRRNRVARQDPTRNP